MSTPKEKAEATIKALAEKKKKKEKMINDYEAHRAGVNKAIKYHTGVYR